MSSVLTSEPKVIALVGNPNCGKTALFNLLTGSRQKVANYAGVTVERKIGSMRLGSGQSVSVIDLPGAYSMKPSTPDERVMMEVITGQRAGEAAPDDLGIGLAGLVNGLSDDHKNYLAAGGAGFLIGDGQLNYGTEDILEGYYLVRVLKCLAITGDYQHVINPGYNRDRGPVDIFSFRIHWQV